MQPTAQRERDEWRPRDDEAAETPKGRSSCDEEPEAMAVGERLRDRRADAGAEGETDHFIWHRRPWSMPARGRDDGSGTNMVVVQCSGTCHEDDGKCRLNKEFRRLP